MSKKSRVLYDLVMRRIVNIFEERFPGKELVVQNIMSDFERAIQGALTNIFPDATATGCYFHYSQVISLTK